MKEITVFELQENFESVMDEIDAGESFVIIGDEGQKIAVLIPCEEFESLNSQDW